MCMAAAGAQVRRADDHALPEACRSGCRSGGRQRNAGRDGGRGGTRLWGSAFSTDRRPGDEVQEPTWYFSEARMALASMGSRGNSAMRRPSLVSSPCTRHATPSIAQTPKGAVHAAPPPQRQLQRHALWWLARTPATLQARCCTPAAAARHSWHWGLVAPSAAPLCRLLVLNLSRLCRRRRPQLAVSEVQPLPQLLSMRSCGAGLAHAPAGSGRRARRAAPARAAASHWAGGPGNRSASGR